MKPIRFDWVDGASTLQWQEEGSRVGYLRQHTDITAMPGPTEYSCVVEVASNGEYEFKLLNGKRGPTLSEQRKASKYLESLGFVVCGSWRRFKNEQPPKLVNIALGGRKIQES